MAKKIKTRTAAQKYLKLFKIPEYAKMAYITEDAYLYFDSEDVAKAQSKGKKIHSIKL